jgi:hypothetical protein
MECDPSILGLTDPPSEMSVGIALEEIDEFEGFLKSAHGWQPVSWERDGGRHYHAMRGHFSQVKSTLALMGHESSQGSR